MELVTEPDLYMPSIDNIGNYIDKIPSFNNLKHGIRCPCGSRKDKTYDTHGVFSTHIKTKTHQKWLNNLNLNKANYYIENENLKTTLHNQRLIIAKLEKEIQNKIMTIDYLTQQLVNNNKTIDLMNFD
jgi:hypothetical protein